MSINFNADFYRIFDSIRYSYNRTEQNTNILACAEEKAQDTANCTSSTIALKDFTKLAKGLGDDGTLTISENEMVPGFFAKLFGTNKDNVFRSEEARAYAQAGGTINRHDIFETAAANEGGLKYAKENDDIYSSALNFARADISAIEKAYTYTGYDIENGKLDFAESNHMNTDAYNTPKKIYKELDLDGDTNTISSEEYASYLIAIDSIFELGGGDVVYKESHADGLLTDEEIVLASNNEEILRQAAQEIYDNNYKD